MTAVHLESKGCWVLISGFTERVMTPSLSSSSSWLFDLLCNIVKFGSYCGWDLSPSEEKLSRVLAGLHFSLDLSHLLLLFSDTFGDWVRLVNVAVSYLLKLWDVHLYLSHCSHDSAPMRCPFGSWSVVFISDVHSGGDYSLLQKTRSDGSVCFQETDKNLFLKPRRDF